MSLFLRSSRSLFSRSLLSSSVSTGNNRSFFTSSRVMGGAAEEITPEEVTDRVLDTVRNYEKVDAAKVTKTSHLIKDLGLDSLDVVEVVMALEDEFCIEIPDEQADNIASIPDAVSYIVNNPHTF